MPVAEGKYQCKFCDDVFEAKSGSYSQCKCGKSEVEPTYWGYSYRNQNQVNVIEQNSYYLEEEFVKLPEDIQKIYDEIKQIKEVNDYKYFLYEMTDKGKNGEKYLSDIKIEHNDYVSKYSSERNSISLSLSLRKDEYRGDERTKERLQQFLEIMKAIESGEFDLSNRDKAYELVEEQGIDYREEPTGETNLTLYF